MSQVVVVSDDLYDRLNRSAQNQGYANIPDFLEVIVSEPLSGDTVADERRSAVASVKAIREKLYAKYGVSQDSTDLVREDRERK